MERETGLGRIKFGGSRQQKKRLTCAAFADCPRGRNDHLIRASDIAEQEPHHLEIQPGLPLDSSTG